MSDDNVIDLGQRRAARETEPRSVPTLTVEPAIKIREMEYEVFRALERWYDHKINAREANAQAWLTDVERLFDDLMQHREDHGVAPYTESRVGEDYAVVDSPVTTD